MKDKTDGNIHKLYRPFLQGHRNFKTPYTPASSFLPGSFAVELLAQ